MGGKGVVILIRRSQSAEGESKRCCHPVASLNKSSEGEVWGGGGGEGKVLCKGAEDFSEKEAVVESALGEKFLACL